MTKKLTIAIDGPAGAGKSTVSRQVADALNYRYLDSGAVYRVITLHALSSNVDVGDDLRIAAAFDEIEFSFQVNKDGHERVWLNGTDVTDDIRRHEVSQAVSKIADNPELRRKLNDYFRTQARGGGVVMDGRDIGTVVLPDADLKVFLTASADERAKRRQAELARRGITIEFDEVLQSIKDRDFMDENRLIAPLKQASDAVVIDSTGLTAERVVEQILSFCHERGERHPL